MTFHLSGRSRLCRVLSLLGYGTPGFLLGPLLGRLANRHGRARLIPLGVAVAAAAALTLAIPLIAVVTAVTVLSLGYDLTQPLPGGIVTDLPGNRGKPWGSTCSRCSPASAWAACSFQTALAAGFTAALGIFGAGALTAVALAVPLFSQEQARRRATDGPRRRPEPGTRPQPPPSLSACGRPAGSVSHGARTYVVASVGRAGKELFQVG